MSDLSAGGPVGGLSAPTLDRQGDAESRDEVLAKRLALLANVRDHRGWVPDNALALVDDFADALEWRIRESIAGEIEAASRAGVVVTGRIAARIARGSSS